MATLRRGLPRTRGGQAWPPTGTTATGAAAAAAIGVTNGAGAAVGVTNGAGAAVGVVERAPAEPERDETRSLPDEAASGVLRRGLPRVAGGEPWPPVGTAIPVRIAAAVVAVAAAGSESAVAARPDVSAPLPFPRTVTLGVAAERWNAARASGAVRHAPEPRRLGPYTRAQWVGAAVAAGGGLLVGAWLTVTLVRWLLSLPALVDFMHTYPGQYALPEGAPVGFSAWLGWQHFFNVFLMTLIIRTGLTVRRDKRPTAFWAPKNDPDRRISLTLWLHQSLDLLWLINGAVFVILLFATGQWMRIVPTSGEVFPNALSAALQYVSLDWPTEDGWVNYNSLQQLAYFMIVFVAAPLAALTGVRMSDVWPKRAKRLSAAYPIEWARAVHFPVMLFFVGFIVVHVALVLATGALRNLNHMYGGSDEVSATGFWILVLSLVVIAAAWVAIRPLVLAPIARLFGRVSGR